MSRHQVLPLDFPTVLWFLGVFRNEPHAALFDRSADLPFTTEVCDSSLGQVPLLRGGFHIDIFHEEASV